MEGTELEEQQSESGYSEAGLLVCGMWGEEKGREGANHLCFLQNCHLLRPEQVPAPVPHWVDTHCLTCLLDR